AIINSGNVAVTGMQAVGVYALTAGADNDIEIVNSGNIYASGTFTSIGVFANSYEGDIAVINAGSISSSSLLAIATTGPGQTSIFNTGVITGYVNLSTNDNLSVNQAGGIFDARLTSFFG